MTPGRFFAETADLAAVDAALAGDLAGKRIVLTGGTGFFGVWLLRALLALPGCRVCLLTRAAGRFRAAQPELAARPGLSIIEGDVRSFAFPGQGADLVIHAAAAADAALYAGDPLAMYDTIVAGTRRVLDCARECGARRVLYVSSGAVYGPQPPQLASVPETYAGGPDPLSPGNAYAEGKRAAELLCAVYADRYGLEIPVARPFAFLGPYLPLDKHFAAGNFLADALAGRTIRIQGDGTPYRSYMYPTDLVVWLLTILVRGASRRAYNVGSDAAVSIAELAAVIAEAGGGLPVSRAREPEPGRPAARYVPCIDRAREELGLAVTVGLGEAVARTLSAYTLQQN